METKQAKQIESKLWNEAVSNCLDDVEFNVYDYLTDEEAEKYEEAVGVINGKE